MICYPCQDSISLVPDTIKPVLPQGPVILAPYTRSAEANACGDGVVLTNQKLQMMTHAVRELSGDPNLINLERHADQFFFISF